jgi:hypothetical protein
MCVVDRVSARRLRPALSDPAGYWTAVNKYAQNLAIHQVGR